MENFNGVVFLREMLLFWVLKFLDNLIKIIILNLLLMIEEEILLYKINMLMLFGVIIIL